VIVDFSIPQALESYIDYAQVHQIPCVIATTGYTEAQECKINNLSQSVAVFKSANFSVGVFVLNQLVKQATEKLMHMDVDVYDVHHKFKQDAPSGTAKQLIQTITNHRALKPETNSMEARQSDKLYIHVSRQGNVVGEHRIVYSDLSETIELKHAAHSKEVFAQGALLAMNWLVQQKAGLYNMEDLWKNS
jgi:4-hydroxy-tetrahydrodipicolinate reductase